MPAHELSTDVLATDAIPDPVAFLMDAEPELEGRMPWSSNATFLATMRCGHGDDAVEQRAVYKPVRGERPLLTPQDRPYNLRPAHHARSGAAEVAVRVARPDLLRPDSG